jgi:hypothetical protein
MNLTQPLISKRCCKCGIEKSINEFYLRSDNNKYRSDCKTCHGLKAKTRWSKDPSFRSKGLKRSRAHTLKTKYGIDEQTYQKMFANQEGKCAICKTTDPGTARDNFAVDHCHTTGEVRGLLCTDCNTTLGKFNDEIERFKAAIAYLEASKSSHT